METINLNTDIKALLDARNQSGLKSLLESWLPDELAILCQDLAPDDMLAVFMAIDRERAFQTFENLDVADQRPLVDILPNRLLALILNDMSADNRTALLEQLESEQLNKLLKLLTQKERAVALSLLGYPENSIGRLMTPEYFTIG
ncbi:MAG: magnesium transporter MgtE N-terminal domain-containing protein, partial [Bacteroidota bacterium]